MLVETLPASKSEKKNPVDPCFLRRYSERNTGLGGGGADRGKGSVAPALVAEDLELIIATREAVPTNFELECAVY